MTANKILFIGDMNSYGRSYLRMKKLDQMGYIVTALTHTPVSHNHLIASPSLLYKITWKLGRPVDETKVNQFIIRLVQFNEYDIIWIEKGNTIFPATLIKIRNYFPNTKIISVSEDDMYAPHSHSQFYLDGLSLYDCVFTTKTYNVDELKQIGAKRVELFHDSFDEDVHKPQSLTESEKIKYATDVGAIGAFEEDRAQKLLFLAENGISVSVWGNDWSGWVNRHPNLHVKNEFLYGLEYSKAICATKINLNFLRKSNRDTITSRSMEIPACGGFMLSERTDRHLGIFREAIEADFFNNQDELLNKTRFYLVNATLRANIAKLGMSKCRNGGFGFKDQLQHIIDNV